MTIRIIYFKWQQELERKRGQGKGEARGEESGGGLLAIMRDVIDCEPW